MMFETLKEKDLLSGEQITLIRPWSPKSKLIYEVNCWSAPMENGDREQRWTREFTDLADAELEYNRWN